MGTNSSFQGELSKHLNFTSQKKANQHWKSVWYWVTPSQFCCLYPKLIEMLCVCVRGSVEDGAELQKNKAQLLPSRSCYLGDSLWKSLASLPHSKTRVSAKISGTPKWHVKCMGRDGNIIYGKRETITFPSTPLTPPSLSTWLCLSVFGT